jgi:hypothetical protein
MNSGDAHITALPGADSLRQKIARRFQIDYTDGNAQNIRPLGPRLTKNRLACATVQVLAHPTNVRLRIALLLAMVRLFQRIMRIAGVHFNPKRPLEKAKQTSFL